MTPRVSVIMATYNWAPVLPWSIASALDQTFTDFELLVVGDGCTDESGDVVEAIGDARVRWLNLPTNTGHQWGPNNAGIREASGELIAYLGHDDLWLPSHLELVLRAIDGGARFAHGTTVHMIPEEGPTFLRPETWAYEPGDWVPPTAVVHDRDLIDTVGPWRPASETGLLDPDTDLWARMAAVVGPPHWVRRTTNVKMAAALRRDVYRDRPHHERSTGWDASATHTIPRPSCRK